MALIIATGVNFIPFTIPGQFKSQTFLALAFFLTGYLFKRSGLYANKKLWKYGIWFLPVIVVVSRFMFESILTAQKLAVPYYAVAMGGSIGVISLCKMFTSGWLVSMMNYIGNRTFYVLTFHFLSYKLVSLGYILYTGDDISRLSEFPFLHNTEAWMCNIYTIVGTGVSLLIWEFFHFPVWKKCFSFLRGNHCNI